MQLYDGIWLASPQIWENIRMIAVCQLDKSEKNVIFADVLINPKIIKKSKKMFFQEEWCLSLPGLEWEVKRHYEVEVEYTDIEGKKQTLKAKWLNSAILQHEIDHLDGILFYDKAINKKEPNLGKLLSL